MQSNFWSGSKNLDRHKTFWDLQKDKAEYSKRPKYSGFPKKWIPLVPNMTQGRNHEIFLGKTKPIFNRYNLPMG